MPSIIIPAIKTPANCSVFTHCALTGSSVDMNAITIIPVGDQVRSAKFPSDYTFLHILF